MGYSCTCAASRCQDKILKAITDPNGSSNAWKYKGNEYFFEVGQEQRDCSITGTIMLMVGTNSARKVGSVKINPDGKLIRWACIPHSVRLEALKSYENNEFADSPMFCVGSNV
jgi:hypothetical protein